MHTTTYDKKTGTKTVLNEKGKTVYFKDGRKEVYDSKGKTVYFKDGTKETYNNKGKTVYYKDGTKETYDSKGLTGYFPDGSKKVINSKGKTEYTAAEAAALKKATTVSNSITSGETVKFVDPKTGITHIKNEAGGKVTYHKYNKDGTFAGGYTENKFAFGAKDGGKKIPISADAYTKKPEVEKMKKEFIPNKSATGQNVAELWKKTTGTSWSEAKKQGLTDGSLNSNLALMAKLKSGDYKPKVKVEPKVETKVEAKPEFKISSNIKPDEVGPYYSKDEDPNKGKMGPIEDPNKPKLKRGGSIKSNITAIKSKIKAKIKAKIKSKIMTTKKKLIKARDGMSTPQDKKSSSGQVTQYNTPRIPGGSTGDVAKSGVGNFKRGGTMKMKTGGIVNNNKKVLVKAMYGKSMMKMGGAKKYLLGGTTGPGDELAKAAGTGKKLTPTTTKSNGAKSSKEPILKKAMYGSSMKPMTPMMKMGGSTLKKAMYGKSMMKPTMMKKGRTTKKK